MHSPEDSPREAARSAIQAVNQGTEAARASAHEAIAREQGYPPRKTAAQLQEEMENRITITRQLAGEMKLRQWAVQQVVPVLQAFAQSTPSLPPFMVKGDGSNITEKMMLPGMIGGETSVKPELFLVTLAKDLTEFFHDFVTSTS